MPSFDVAYSSLKNFPKTYINMSLEPSETDALTAADYAVFGVTLGISAALGIFFAIKDQNSRGGMEGYMMGAGA